MADDVLDHDLHLNETVRLTKLRERRAEAARSGAGTPGGAGAGGGEDAQHARAAAVRAKNAAMAQAAGTAYATTALPAADLLASMDVGRTFVAPALVTGKRCALDLVVL